jgi:hypothetical protein
VVRIEQSHLKAVSGLQFKLNRCFQGYRFLSSVSLVKTILTSPRYKQVSEMPISLDAGFQDTPGIVDSARVSLQAKKHLFRGSRAVDATRCVSQGAVTGRPNQRSYNGDRRLSKPFR